VWGGGIGASSIGLVARARALGAHAADGLWPTVLLGAVAVAARRPSAGGASVALLAALALPYGAWALLWQNVAHERHAAPVTLVLAVATAAALGLAAPSWRHLRTAALGLTLVLGAAAAARARAETPWRPEAVRWVASHLGLERVLVVGTHLPRVAAWYLPELRTARAFDGADVARLARAAGEGVTVVVASEVPGLEEAGLGLEPLGAFGAATLYRAHAPLALAERP
jgi:hypothetical protein